MTEQHPQAGSVVQHPTLRLRGAHPAAKAISRELYTADAPRLARGPAPAFSREAALYYAHSCSQIFKLEDVCAWETGKLFKQ